MQKWKKFLATLTAGALCAVALPLAKLELPEVVMNAAAAECTVPVGTGTTTLTYEVQEDDTVEITDCEDTAAGELEIPAEIDGKAVTRIGDMAFNDKEYLTGITVPDSVKTIGDKAFTDCISAAYINLPQEMDSLGEAVFNSCYALEEITIPEGITELSSFVEKDEEGVALYYGSLAFCKALKKVTLPSTLKTIDEYTFSSCPALESIEIPNGVTEIKEGAFKSCESLVSIEIPKSVTNIADWLFDSCSFLESVTIPDSIEKIGYAAFGGCFNLKEISIPSSVTYIGDCAFSYSGLTDVYYDGTKEQWNAIEIVNNTNEYANNDLLIYATKHFSDGTQATSTGDLDGNGTVDTNDVFEAMLYVAYRGAGMSGNLRAEQITAADIDGDGSVDSTDVYYILYYVALQGAGKKPTWDSVLGR